VRRPRAVRLLVERYAFAGFQFPSQVITVAVCLVDALWPVLTGHRGAAGRVRCRGRPRHLRFAREARWSSIERLLLWASCAGWISPASGVCQAGSPSSARTGDELGVSQVLNNLGELSRRGGDPATAITYYARDLSISRRLGDRQGESASLNNLGKALHALGRLEEAMATHRRRSQVPARSVTGTARPRSPPTSPRPTSVSATEKSAHLDHAGFERLTLNGISRDALGEANIGDMAVYGGHH
jgi:hypothetical protein